MGEEITKGQALPVAAGERCELGDGLSGTAFLVDWQGDGGRDILYSLLPNMHGGGVYRYRERRAGRGSGAVVRPSRAAGRGERLPRAAAGDRHR